jgi:hypothetical protein
MLCILCCSVEYCATYLTLPALPYCSYSPRQGGRAIIEPHDLAHLGSPDHSSFVRCTVGRTVRTVCTPLVVQTAAHLGLRGLASFAAIALHRIAGTRAAVTGGGFFVDDLPSGALNAAAQRIVCRILPA